MLFHFSRTMHSASWVHGVFGPIEFFSLVSVARGGRRDQEALVVFWPGLLHPSCHRKMRMSPLRKVEMSP
jgi:hypothetical protein